MPGPQEPDFEGDRVVVHEEEEKNKKKGWFSRKSTSTPQHRPPVSRPPSTASWAKPTTAGGAAQSGVDDSEDLPPRMESSHAGPAATTLSASPGTLTPPVRGTSSQSASGRSTPTIRLPEPDNLPSKTAGFDLSALKDAVKDVANNPSDLKGQTAVASAAAHLSAYSQGKNDPTRPQSTPPTSQLGVSTHIGRSGSFDYDRGDISTPLGNSFGGDRTPFHRSVSEDPQGSSFTPSSSSSYFRDEPSARTPRPAANDLPPEALGGWGLPSANPFASNSNLSSSSSSLGFGAGATPSLSFNSFSNGSRPSTGSSSGLSFGGSDGTITAPPTADPWMTGSSGFNPPPVTRKGTNDSFASNPWG